MPERINGGQGLAAVGAIGLIVSLFLHWYEPGRSAWAVFEAWDLILAAIGIAALAAVVPLPRGSGRPESVLAPRWLPILGGAATVIVVASLINHPPAARDSSPELGIWIALASAFVLTAGGILTTARISLVITVRPSDSTRPRSPAPEEAPAEVYDAETKTQPIPRQGRP